MRFGYFFYPTCMDPKSESTVINDCLGVAEFVEEIGLDAIWLAEHHFIGEVAYGDPLVFAGAVAMKTNKILLGLGVVEMALHNPVRLAIQTALIDHLSCGRLIVGTGRGSNYNSFEYAGFGTTFEAGYNQLAEAEDLLIKSWTTENVKHEGEFWKVAFPATRPRPYQRPHPPIARACISDDSVIAMAKIGRPVLHRGRSIADVGRSIQLHKDTMESSGFDRQAVERALDDSWVWYESYIAETSKQALDEFMTASGRASDYILEMRRLWNPTGQKIPEAPFASLPQSNYEAVPNPTANELLVGSPDRVNQQLKLLQEMGVRNLMLTDRSLVSREMTENSLRMLSEDVIPAFR